MGSRVTFKGFKANRAGIKQFINTASQQPITEAAQRMTTRANSNAQLKGRIREPYSYKTGKNKEGFFNATVHTNSYVGKLDNSKNNTLLKSAGA